MQRQKNGQYGWYAATVGVLVFYGKHGNSMNY